MQHGSDNEINAVATMCTKVLLVYFPHINYVEVGVFRFPKANTSACNGKNPKGKGGGKCHICFPIQTV